MQNWFLLPLPETLSHGTQTPQPVIEKTIMMHQLMYVMLSIYIEASSWSTKASYFAIDIFIKVVFDLSLWNGREVSSGGVGGGNAVFLALKKCTFFIFLQISANLPGLRSSLVPK